MPSESALERNRALIARLYAEGMNRRDPDAAAAFYAEDAKNHGRAVGRAGMRRVFEALFAAFPDFHYDILEAIAEGDRVVCKVKMTGTHRGEPTMREAFNGMLAGVAPTGKSVEVLQFHSFVVRAEAIAEHAAVRDDLGMLKQLGLISEPRRA